MAFRKKRKKKRAKSERPMLYYAQILAWADEHHRRTGQWPTHKSGWIPNTPGEKWYNVNQNLWRGERGLRPGSSLARLLAEERGRRNQKALPALTVKQILQWADCHYRRTGQWPNQSSGPVLEAPGETWAATNSSLALGARGLPGGSTLAGLLQAHRDVRNIQNLPSLTVAQILAWADAVYQRTGRWPKKHDGPIRDGSGETWANVDSALAQGYRGLRNGSSLVRLLAKERKVRNKKALPTLTYRQILRWADAHHQRTGAWPHSSSGPIQDAPGETWDGVYSAFKRGSRGLRSGSSLAKLLAEKRGARNKQALPALTQQLILRWADAHHQRTGTWPLDTSGPIQDAPGETWGRVATALDRGARGLRPGWSLPRLLAKYRNVRNHLGNPLTVAQLLRWADAHYSRTGHWPKTHGGPITDASGETWSGVDNALRNGGRGLPPGGSLPRLLAAHGRTDGRG